MKKLVGALSVMGLFAIVTVGLATAATRPDLVELSVAPPPAAVAVGERFTGRDTARNRGATVAARSATGYYLSRDRVRNAHDIAIGRRSVPRLTRRKSSHAGRIVTVPPSTPLGLFFLLACADDRKLIRESNERNNCRASASRVLVSAPTPAAPPPAPPSAPTCREQLGLLGVNYAAGPSSPGVDDPVTMYPPLNGISFTSSGAQAVQIFMDCSLALALHRVAGDLAARQIDTIDHLGTYNYRCIGGGIPSENPGCTLSEHARGRAIDFASFSGAGVTYDVEDDWVIDPDPEETCTAATTTVKDQVLHDLACAWAAANLFNIILTPNYSAVYRNHIHVDLTPGSDYIQ